MRRRVAATITVRSQEGRLCRSDDWIAGYCRRNDTASRLAPRTKFRGGTCAATPPGKVREGARARNRVSLYRTLPYGRSICKRITKTQTLLCAAFATFTYVFHSFVSFFSLSRRRRLSFSHRRPVRWGALHPILQQHDDFAGAGDSAGVGTIRRRHDAPVYALQDGIPTVRKRRPHAGVPPSRRNAKRTRPKRRRQVPERRSGISPRQLVEETTQTGVRYSNWYVRVVAVLASRGSTEEITTKSSETDRCTAIYSILSLLLPDGGSWTPRMTHTLPSASARQREHGSSKVVPKKRVKSPPLTRPPAFARYSVHTCVILRTIRVRENRIGKYAASSFIISY